MTNAARTNLEVGVEHALDEGGLLENLVGVPHELQLLHHLKLRIQLKGRARQGYAEACSAIFGGGFRDERVHTEQRCFWFSEMDGCVRKNRDDTQMC